MPIETVQPSILYVLRWAVCLVMLLVKINRLMIGSSREAMHQNSKSHFRHGRVADTDLVEYIYMWIWNKRQERHIIKMMIMMMHKCVANRHKWHAYKYKFPLPACAFSMQLKPWKLSKAFQLMEFIVSFWPIHCVSCACALAFRFNLWHQLLTGPFFFSKTTYKTNPILNGFPFANSLAGRCAEMKWKSNF